MLHLDAAELYDLPEAARLLFADPARLAREARLGKIPSARVGRSLGLPAPWGRRRRGARAGGGGEHAALLARAAGAALPERVASRAAARPPPRDGPPRAGGGRAPHLRGRRAARADGRRRHAPGAARGRRG